MTDATRALTFGQVAEEYDRWRPSYSDAAVDWLAPPTPARVAELGAGTGKLTSLLLFRGLTVDVVEPDRQMLAVLARNNPDARCHRSDSTSVLLEDGSLDAVLVADAWHWFDTDATIVEVRRALKPGGWLGLVWNVVADPVAPWEIELAGESDTFDRDTKGSVAGVTRRLSYFPDDELEFGQFAWAWEITPEHHAAHLATTSMAIAMAPRERQKYLDAARTDFQRVCDAAGRDAMPIRHDASCERDAPRPGPRTSQPALNLGLYIFDIVSKAHRSGVNQTLGRPPRAVSIPWNGYVGLMRGPRPPPSSELARRV